MLNCKVYNFPTQQYSTTSFLHLIQTECPLTANIYCLLNMHLPTICSTVDRPSPILHRSSEVLLFSTFFSSELVKWDTMTKIPLHMAELKAIPKSDMSISKHCEIKIPLWCRNEISEDWVRAGIRDKQLIEDAADLQSLESSQHCRRTSV